MTGSPLSAIGPYPLLHRGKVRETYDLGNRLLLVASDRVSAFDWVLPTPIPDKGKVLTAMSSYWFRLLGKIVPNHFVSDGSNGWPLELVPERERFEGRAMLVKKARRVDYECVVRGYLAGSGWQEYTQSGTLAGERLPTGLREGDKLPEPRFTPARKNERGHDENISFHTMYEEVGKEESGRLRDLSLELYEVGGQHVEAAGIMLADTKFEFGYVGDELTLIDEVLTPDSSRFWLASEWRPGRPQPSLDKQYVRDWLLLSSWDRNSTPPDLPPDVVRGTRERYLEAYQLITGKELEV